MGKEKLVNKKKTSRQKYITEEEYKKFLSVIKDPVDHLMFLLCGNLGLRVGELVRLRVVDLLQDEKGYFLRVPTLKRGGEKGIIRGAINRGSLPDTYEEIALSSGLEVLATMIKNYISKRKITNWLFPYGDSHIPEYSVARKFKRCMREVGLDPRYSIHSLRHFKGYQSYKRTKDLKAVQVLLRHRDIKTTSIYADADLETKRAISEKLELIK